MQNNVRYYIVKRDDQPVVRSVAIERSTAAIGRTAPATSAQVEPKLSVTSRLRLALRRKQAESRPA